MTDYDNELLADFGSESDHDADEAHCASEDTLSHELAPWKGEKVISLDDALAELLSVSGRLIDSFESTENVRSLSKVLQIALLLREQISKYSDDTESAYWDLLSSLNRDTQSQEYKFILTLNEVSQSINEEISMFHTRIKSMYKPVFGELETLIIHPVDYARTVLVIKQDLKAIKTHDTDLRSIMSHEKVLVAIMAALQQLSRTVFKLNSLDWARVKEACTIVVELDELLQCLTQFITTKLAKFAPNVSAVVGPVTASQLIIATGSLKQLAHTPSCNIAAYGTKEHFSHKGSLTRQVRQNGYLFHSDLVKFLPLDIVRPSMRIISGKVVLAARIDLGKSHEDGQMGVKYAQEIQEKVDKLLAPPELAASKALPTPVDMKSKKRGGRRIRKMKERFQMSELRKAQNKMEFGKKEETVFDAFGEEIGMGMSRGHAGLGRIGQPRVNANTKAKMSKGMASRLDQLQQKRGGINELDAYLLQETATDSRVNTRNPWSSTGTTTPTTTKTTTPTTTTSANWFSEMEAKRPSADQDAKNSKRQKSL